MREFEQYRKIVLRNVEDVGRQLVPQGDWPPALMLEDDEGTSTLPLSDVWGGADSPKAAWAKQVLIPSVIREAKPHVVTLISSANISLPETGETSERVFVHLVCAAGESYNLAEIKRSAGEPPELGEWLELEPILTYTMTGTVVDALRQTMREIHGPPEKRASDAWERRTMLVAMEYAFRKPENLKVLGREVSDLGWEAEADVNGVTSPF